MKPGTSKLRFNLDQIIIVRQVHFYLKFLLFCSDQITCEEVLDYITLSFEALAKMKEVSSDYSVTHEYLIADTRAFWVVVTATMRDPRCYHEFYVGTKAKIPRMSALPYITFEILETNLHQFAGNIPHTAEKYYTSLFFRFKFDILTF